MLEIPNTTPVELTSTITHGSTQADATAESPTVTSILPPGDDSGDTQNRVMPMSSEVGIATGATAPEETQSFSDVFLPPVTGGKATGDSLVIVEGFENALALATDGIRAIGISRMDVCCNNTGGERVILPGITGVIEDFTPARVLLLGAADSAVSLSYIQAAVDLAEKLSQPVLLPRLGKLGLDKSVREFRDTLGDGSTEFWQRAIDTALPIERDMDFGAIAALLFDSDIPWISELSTATLTRYIPKIVQVIAHCADVFCSDRLIESVSRRFRMSKKELKGRVAEARQAAHPQGRGHGAHVTAWPDHFQSTIDQNGAPIFLDEKEGRTTRGQINERFWAGLYATENEVMFLPSEEYFYEYNSTNGLWENRTIPSIEQGLAGLLLDNSREYPEVLGGVERFTNHRTQQAICAQLRGIAEVKEANPFVRTKRYIHCSNGMVEFEPGNVTPIINPFNSDFLSRNAVPVAYNKDAICPQWEAFLKNAISPDDVSLLKRYFGCVVLQYNDPGRIMILRGRTATGKSVIASIACKMVGEPNVGAFRPKHIGNRFEIGRMLGKSLLLGSDVDAEFLRHEDSDILKSLVGGDKQPAERKGLNGTFIVDGIFNMLVTTNERLGIRSGSDRGSYRRRLMIIPFNAPPVEKPIPRFADHLFQTEGEGILRWAIDGAAELLREIKETGDYKLTAEQQAEIDAVLGLRSSLEEFVCECIEQTGDTDGLCEKQDLTKEEIELAYADYCRKRNILPEPKRVQQAHLPELILRLHGALEAHSIRRDMADGTTKDQRGFRGVRFSTKVTVIKPFLDGEALLPPGCIEGWV